MTITYRTTKGVALKYGEVDENFRDLLEDTTIDRVLGNGNTTSKAVTVGSLTSTNVSANSIATDSLKVIGPVTPGGTGQPGQITWDADFLYVCVATNTWKKVALEAV